MYVLLSCVHQENLEFGEFFIHLGFHMKETGMSLEDLKSYIQLWEKGQDGVDQFLQILYNHQEEVKAKVKLYQENL
ncbi:hypothetical protein [Halobacillus andaensis]|uniref:hypothetical protein n=1 Tax=Halobacillus andaensis TaxID=1176239 RepID=UPI003D705702